MKYLRAVGAWAWQTVIAIDQLANAITGGWADETLSSRAWRTEQKGRILGGFFRPVIDVIFFLHKEHCRKAYISERSSIHLPPEMRPTPAQQAMEDKP